MKKIFALVLALFLALSLCACGVDSSNNSQTPDNNQTPSSNTPDGKPSLVGTWEHVRTDDEPYGTIMTFNADGTGISGKSGKTTLEWTETEEGKFAITIIFDEDSRDETTAYFTEDGKLCWQYEMNIQLSDGSMITIQEMLLTKQ